MRRKTNQALPYGRMYARLEHQSVASSEKSYYYVMQLLGRSAASTYYGLRSYQGLPVGEALAVARQQAQELGRDYLGGPECCKYRRPRH